MVFSGLSEHVLFLVAANLIMATALGIRESLFQLHLTKCFTTKPFLITLSTGSISLSIDPLYCFSYCLYLKL